MDYFLLIRDLFESYENSTILFLRNQCKIFIVLNSKNRIVKSLKLCLKVAPRKKTVYTYVHIYILYITFRDTIMKINMMYILYIYEKSQLSTPFKGTVSPDKVWLTMVSIVAAY